MLRMQSTRIAYWKVFKKDCEWLKNEWSLYTVSEEDFILIKHLSGTLSVNVNLEITVLTLKELIRDLKGIPIHIQCFVYNQKVLQDNFLLSDYNVGSQSVLFLVIRLGYGCGPGCDATPTCCIRR